MSENSTTVSLDYEPRTWQRDLHRGASKARFVLAIVGRQQGKSHAGLMEIIDRALNVWRQLSWPVWRQLGWPVRFLTPA